MKFAATLMTFFGGWVIGTVLIGGLLSLQPDGKPDLPMIQAVTAAAPWTLGLASAMGCIVAGIWLFDRAEKRDRIRGKRDRK